MHKYQDPFKHLHDENCVAATQLRALCKALQPPQNTQPGKGMYPVIEGYWTDEDGVQHKVILTRQGLRNIRRKMRDGSSFTLTRIQRNQNSREIL